MKMFDKIPDDAKNVRVSFNTTQGRARFSYDAEPDERDERDMPDEDTMQKYCEYLENFGDPVDVLTRYLDDDATAVDSRRRARGARRKLGRDDPPEFPGRPRVGGGKDPLEREAADRRSRARHAMDAGGDLGFADRFPAAGRVARW